MASYLYQWGMEVVREPREADVVLINTCGFIEDAKKESIHTIFKILSIKNQGNPKKIYVWGCLAERYKGQIEQMIPEIDGFFGVEPFKDIKDRLCASSIPFNRNGYSRYFLSTPPGTAYLKIAEGCNHSCTFCAIPLFKGPYRSRSLKSLVYEAKLLAERGIKELILIGQDTTRYGYDRYNKSRLIPLLERLIRIDGIQWIRLMYTHPLYITDELIDFIADKNKMCHYLDIPFQHISDKILQAMGRGTSRLMIENLITRLRNRIPDLVLRTAFIVGFPGEEEKEFSELIDFIQEVRFERLGGFIFSPEEGTQAYHLKPRIPKNEIKKRYQTLLKLQKTISQKNNQRLESQTFPVIIDGYDRKQELFFGRSQGDCLDVDQRIWIRDQATVGDISIVKIDGSGPYDLIGTIV